MKEEVRGRLKAEEKGRQRAELGLYHRRKEGRAQRKA